MRTKSLLRVGAAFAFSAILILTAFLQTAYSAEGTTGAKYEELRRLINGESGIFKEFSGDLKANANKVKNTGKYYRGSEIYKYSDGSKPNLYILFHNRDELRFYGAAATEGNFFGIEVGKDNVKDVAAVLGSPALFEQTGEMPGSPLYMYDRPGGRLFIVCNADNIIIDIYMRFSYCPEYGCVGRIENGDLTDNYNYSFDVGNKSSYKGEALLMSHGRFLPQYDIMLHNDDQASCSLEAIEAITGAIAVEGNGAVTITKGNTSLTINGNKAIFTKDGETQEMDIRTAGRIGQTLYLPLRPVAEAFGKKVGYLPAASGYTASQAGIAYNPVVWVDDPEYMDNNTKTNDDALNWLKEFMTTELNKLKNADSNDLNQFSFDEHTLALIEKNIMNARYIGQVGRYAYFSGPYATLVDFHSNTVYFNYYGHSYGSMSNATTRSSDGLLLFTNMYFTD